MDTIELREQIEKNLSEMSPDSLKIIAEFEKKTMIKPELFDLVELLVDLPEYNLTMGEQGTIVEDYNDGCYEIEFSNDRGETIALCPLPMQQFIVIWKAKSKTWLSLTEKLTALIDKLPKEKQQKILDFTRSLYQKN